MDRTGSTAAEGGPGGAGQASPEAPGGAVAAPMKSLFKGLQALDALQGGQGVRTTDLAETLGIDKGVASRILQTLTLAGYARRIGDRRYVPGPKLAGGRSGRRPRPRIRERVRPVLKSLVEMTGESAHVGIIADDQVLYLEREVPDVTLRVDRPVGTLAPLHSTALGKVFLAFIPAGPDRPPVPASLMPGEDELAATVRRGFAIDDEGLCVGVRCVAAPIRDGEGEVIAAISLSGPTVRIDRQRLQSLGAIVKEHADMLSRP